MHVAIRVYGLTFNWDQPQLEVITADSKADNKAYALASLPIIRQF